MKPQVGIIYLTSADRESIEFQNFSFYLCGVLADTGYAEVHLIPFSLILFND